MLASNSNRIYNNTIEDISDSYAVQFGPDTGGNVAKNNIITRATAGAFDPESRLRGSNLLLNNFEGDPEGKEHPATALTRVANRGINSDKLKVHDCLYFAVGDLIELGDKSVSVVEIDYETRTLYIAPPSTWDETEAIQLTGVENIGETE